MSSAALLKMFESTVELSPVAGSPSIYLILPKSLETPIFEVPPMTDDDWDKFESDINAAFEQLS